MNINTLGLCASVIAMIAMIATVIGMPSESSAEMPPAEDQAEFIPTRFVIPPDPLQYPSPVFVGSTVTPVRLLEGAEAVFSVTLREDANTNIEGEFELTVHLVDSEVELQIPGVKLIPGVTNEYTLLAGFGWAWDEVINIDISFGPTMAPA